MPSTPPPIILIVGLAVVVVLYAAAPLVLYGIFHRLGKLIDGQTQLIAEIQALRSRQESAPAPEPQAGYALPPSWRSRLKD
jgi:hypothetical protein